MKSYEELLESTFIKKIDRTINEYSMINKKDKVIVGVSGGADSIALLIALYILRQRYQLEIVVVHINHMLRGEAANRDEQFVESFCRSFDIKCESIQANVQALAEEMKLSLEEAGRKVRYREFKRIFDNELADKIAIAHHINDQAETILLNMIRGAGLKGLGGIRPVRDLIIRPLIEVRREEIVEFCENNGLGYVHDMTNFDNDYTRNKVRNQLIPMIEENFNYNIVNQLHKMGKLLREEQIIIDDVINEYMKQLVIIDSNNQYRVDVNKLSALKQSVRKRIYRKVIEKINGNLVNVESKHIDLIDHMIYKGTGKAIDLPGGLMVKISYNELMIFKKKEENIGFYYHVDELLDDIYMQEINTTVKFRRFKYHEGVDISRKTYTKWFDYDKMKDGFSIRSRETSDYINLKGMVGRKKIKNLFIDNKIETHNREKVALITNGHEVIWAIGLRVNKNYMITENTETVLEIQVDKEANDEI